MKRNGWSFLNWIITGIALCGAAGQVFGAERLSREQLRAMPPDQLREYILKRVQEQALRAALARPGDVDVTPPVLSQFSLPTQVRAGDPILGSYTATDDESGVRDVYACGYGPHGQSTCVWSEIEYPTTRSKGTVGDTTAPLLEPGVYTFTYGYATDVAGNWAYYDQAALAALGNTVVTIQNPGKWDASPPTMLSGKILTPSLSLSATVPGTSQPRYAGMQIQVQDIGNTAVAGTQSVDAAFCLLDYSHCFYLYGYQYGSQTPKSTLILGNQPDYSGTLTAGDYHLEYVYMGDYAGNYRELVSTEFGGQTDFSQLMPSTVITLKP